MTAKAIIIISCSLVLIRLSIPQVRYHLYKFSNRRRNRYCLEVLTDRALALQLAELRRIYDVAQMKAHLSGVTVIVAGASIEHSKYCKLAYQSCVSLVEMYLMDSLKPCSK